jgi:saccharopine dehydrogenase-like NADP-dependent oxidoreductase
MKVLLVGVGGVGESIAAIAKRRDPKGEWMELMVLADYNLSRAQEVAAKIGEDRRFPCEKVDARSVEEMVTLAKKHKVDLIMNACDPSFNMQIFDAAYEAGCTYMDMAMSLSELHPTEPLEKAGIKLGDLQFAQAKKWEDKGVLALLGAGVEPGMADIFARYADKHLFDEIEEINIRDGNNLVVKGYDVAFGFSVWTTIEECLNPPVIWERDKGWFVTPPFSEPEVFNLPEGIGPVEMVNVEHEEVLLVPRYIDKGLKRVTFKFGLGSEFINVLKILHALGLDNKEKVKVGKVEVAPRDVIAATAPDPAHLGDVMFGKTCAGTWITGKKNGLKRSVYLYQVADNQECMQKFLTQAVVAQTAFTPVLAMELLHKGVWKGVGVQGPEYFDPDPYMAMMEEYEFPLGIQEMDSEYKQALDNELLQKTISEAAATK